MVEINEKIAQKLREQAHTLACQGSNLYRVRAFRAAALAVLGLPVEVTELLAAGGVRALERVPGIGKSLAHTIAGYAQSLSPSHAVQSLSPSNDIAA
ncbi:MAG: helix-hairpin-helix domain-containing protein [Gemmataceae bacterium]|nr:helix-hairpin-helix domain-containing protein [Gemmata sp.]MDW8199557.1 helix-hairpin-helix domain-containing protein [Gemmataceae bacterium]